MHTAAHRSGSRRPHRHRTGGHRRHAAGPAPPRTCSRRHPRTSAIPHRAETSSSLRRPQTHAGLRMPTMKAKKAKRVPPAKSKSRAMRERPKMPPISEEMKQWSAMLKTEVSGWPQLSTKPMFGMMGLYRGKKIFGGLPVTRGFDTPNSVIFRFDPIPSALEERASKDKRISPGKRWFSFDVRSTEDLRDALWWLNQAYEKTK